MKKSLIIFLSIFLVAIIAAISTSHANMFNRFKKGFYFEKYSTAEEAKAELLKLHPIGSEVDALVRTLEGAGAVVKLHKTNNEEVIYFYEYNNGIAIINPLKWSGRIRFDPNKNIIDFGIGKQYMGL